MERASGDSLFVTECNSTDATQLWDMKTDGGATTIRGSDGRCWGEEGGRDLRAGACGSAAEFVYSAETEQLSEAGRRWMCVDNSNPQVGLYSCHNASSADLNHQQFTLRKATPSKVQLVNTWTRKCVAVRAAPGRHHASIALPAGRFARVEQFAEGVDLAKAGGLVMDVVYNDGVRQPHQMLSKIEPVAAAPTDLRTRHLHWDPADFPSLESASAANAVTMCGAKGDGRADDHAALQGCLNKHRDVFLPKGLFRLSQTLRMNAGTTTTLVVILP